MNENIDCMTRVSMLRSSGALVVTQFPEFSITIISRLRNSFRYPASPDSNLRSGEVLLILELLQRCARVGPGEVGLS